MSVFSKLSASKKQAQKLQEEKKQKAKADGEPKPKYMHTPKHAYVDALNCVAGPGPGNSRESIREASERAAERRKSRLSQHSSRATMNGLQSAHSSMSGFNTMVNSGDSRRAVMQRDQLQICGPSGIGSSRRSYQSSPLASCTPSTAGPSTVSSYEKLEMASLAPAPLRPSIHRRPSSLKKSVTIQDPSEESVPLSPTSQSSMSDKGNDVLLLPVLEAPHKISEMDSGIIVQSTEISAELSSEEEKEMHPKKKNNHKRISMFWKKRSNPVVVAA